MDKSKLNDDSKEILDFIKPFIKETFINSPYISEMLDKCTKSLNIKYSKQVTINKINTNIADLQKYIFISSEIKEYIKKNMQHTYVIKMDNLNMNIHMKDTYDGNINLFKLLVIINLLNNENHKKKLDIDIFCTPIKKLLHIDDKVITKNHVNSGLTYDKKHVMVWRYEELYKVFIHELIHYYAYDFFDEGHIDDHLTKTYNATSNINSCEAYTELWAVIIHCIFNAAYLKDTKLFNVLIQYEIYFSVFQTAKILVHFNFHSMEEFLAKSSKKIKQDTNVCSYYIIKSALLFNIVLILKYFPTINFKESKENFDLFKTLIDKSMNDPLFIKSVNTFIEYIKNNKLNDFLKKTLRMTCVELR